MSEPIDVSQLSTEEVMSLQQKLYDEARKRRLDLETMQQHAEEKEAKTFKQSAEFQELESHIEDLQQELDSLIEMYPDGIEVRINVPLVLTYKIENEFAYNDDGSLRGALADGHYPEDVVAISVEAKLDESHGLSEEVQEVLSPGIECLLEDGDPDVVLMETHPAHSRVNDFVDSLYKLTEKFETIQKAIKYKAI